MICPPLKDYCLSPDATLLQAFDAIERGGGGIALIVASSGKLIATLTDGDARRALLKGNALSEPALPFGQKNFITTNPRASRAEILDLMQARVINQIPIVDEGKLVGLHLLHKVLGASEKPNAAILMAGGRGKRLGPLTDQIPKPMLKVAGRPILERLVLHLVGYGIKKIYISVHYLAQMITSHFEDGFKFGCKIEYLREEEPLGTGGCLSLLPPSVDEPILVCNGDLVTQANVENFLDFHTKGKFAATVAVRTHNLDIPFGVIKSKHGKVESLIEKPTVSHEINAGMYVLNPEIIRKVPNQFFPITELFEKLLIDGQQVGAFPIEEDWIDVGQRENLDEARGNVSI